MHENNPSYYLAFGETVKGPYTIEQLRAMWAKGSIKPDTLLCLEGARTWGTVREIAHELKAKNTKSTNRIGFWGGTAIVIACLIAAALGKFGVQRTFQALSGKKSPSPAARFLERATWQTRTVGNLLLEAPCGFVSEGDFLKGAPPQVRVGIESSETFKSDSGSPHLFVQIARSTWQPNVPVNLDRAVSEAIASVAPLNDSPLYHYVTSSIQISNRPGTRLVYISKADGRDIHWEVVFVQNRQELVQIQVVYYSPDVAPAAKRILDSVQITDP